ncbi:hypothetical protein BDV96DRAFT_451740, partial [Lophiotrema nucula]
CIDKRSSSETSESINSMFKWYKDADECYVYLSDYDGSDQLSDLSSCRWFSRGWTLQELIAPRCIRVYDKNWIYHVSINKTKPRDEWTSYLSKVTGIDPYVFSGVELHKFSVAQRMSWASRRNTTRSEDMAYSLLGIFGINMPLLYGEGRDRAFLRLQEEIIKGNNDMSIFAWMNPTNTTSGILATSPADFQNSGAI